MPYGLVEGGAAIREAPPGKYVKYNTDGTDCPAVVIDPRELLRDVEAVFQAYLSDLKNADPQHNSLRANFKKKLSRCFGVDVTTAQ